MKRESICPAIRELLPSLAEGTLGGDAEAAVRDHLGRCAECGRIWEVMNGIRKEREREDEPPIEQFVKKHRRRRLGIALAAAVSVLLLLAGTAALITALSGGVDIWSGDDGGTPNAVWTTGDNAGGESGVPVSVRFRLFRRHYRLPWEKGDAVYVTELVVTGQEGEVLFDFDPYGFGKPMGLPVLKGDGILSPLCAIDTRDPLSVKHAGRIVSADGMRSFVLQGKGFTLFYPAASPDDAGRMIREIRAFCDKNGAPLGPWFGTEEENE